MALTLEVNSCASAGGLVPEPVVPCSPARGAATGVVAALLVWLGRQPAPPALLRNRARSSACSRKVVKEPPPGPPDVVQPN